MPSNFKLELQMGLGPTSRSDFRPVLYTRVKRKKKEKISDVSLFPEKKGGKKKGKKYDVSSIFRKPFSSWLL